MPLYVGIPYQPYSFLIKKLDGLIVAQNDKGRIQFSNTDASTVIKSAINALEAEGGKIVIKAGTYPVTDTIFIRKSNVSIIGEGWSTKLFLADGVNKDVLCIDPIGAGLSIEGILLSDFMIDGNRANNTSGHCIKVNSDATYTFFSSTIRNLRLMNAYFAGFYSLDASELFLESIHAGWCLNGIELYRVSESEIHTIVSEGYQDGIQLIDCKRIRAYAEGEFQPRYGIYLKNTNEVDLHFLAFHNKKHGVFLENSHFNRIRGVSSSNSQEGDGLYDGVNLLDSGNNILRVMVMGESSTLRHRTGIREEGTSDWNLIAGCHVGLYNVSPIVKVGANTVIRHNIGYVTENSGTTTFTAGVTSVTVSHGLVTTPKIVLITPHHSEIADIRVTAKTATDFTVEVSTAPTADRTFDWYAEV